MQCKRHARDKAKVGAENDASERYAREKAKAGPRQKPWESVQCKAQNQNRVPTGYMGIVGMYRDQRNAKGGDQNGFGA